jgi:hypothetical protein
MVVALAKEINEAAGDNKVCSCFGGIEFQLWWGVWRVWPAARRGMLQFERRLSWMRDCCASLLPVPVPSSTPWLPCLVVWSGRR